MVNINGTAGNAIPEIPEIYRPSTSVYAPVIVRSDITSRQYLGYLNFLTDGSVIGGVFPEYACTPEETDPILTASLHIYGTAEWITQ